MTVRRLLWVVIFAGAVTAVRAADVTLGAYNVERTGYTSEKLAPPLALQWKFTVGEDPAHASAPLCVGDRIFHCALGMVYSLDAESGAVIWSYNTRFQIRATPVLHNNRLFVCTVNGQIHVLDPADESQERVFGVLDIRGGITSDPLIVGEDLFLVADSGRFFRINSATYDSKELHKFDVGAKSYLAWDGENIIFTGTDNRCMLEHQAEPGPVGQEPGQPGDPTDDRQGRRRVGHPDDLRLVKTVRRTPSGGSAA